jgi:pimeloyl-ACP methyl ester carboxylesterase
MSVPIQPFRLEVPEAQLDDLRARLANTRWPDALEEAGWEYGTEREWLREICEYWRTSYDWRAQEAVFNRYEQGMATVQGEQVHFLHVRSPHPGAIPMVMTHGWGGSVVEFLGVIDRLVDPPAFGGDAVDAYHLVIPAMPGFGFSGPTRQRGFHVQRVGDAVADLMEALGYERYVAQGGDWGSLVTRHLAERYGDRLLAAHFTQLFAFPTEQDTDVPPLSDEDAAKMATSGVRAATGTGYLAIQTTKPQSLAFAQTDSPAGLAGWMLEKFHAWVDHDGDVEAVLSKDQLLTNLMLYWLPNTVLSSARLYFESGAAGVHATDPWNGRVTVPTGYTVYPNELMYTPRDWAERRYNMVYWAEQPRGGHFAAFEQPEAFATDLLAFGRVVRAL